VSEKARVLVAGASGFTGALAAQIVHDHPRMELVAVTSRSDAGTRLDRLYPRYRVPLELTELDLDALDGIDAAIVAYPHGASAPTVAALRERGIVVADLSADFRLRDRDTYDRWYGEHKAPDLFGAAVYGLTELYRDRLREAKLVAEGLLDPETFTQTDDHLLIQSEETHAVRIIPLTPRPGLGRDLKLWQGDSRGRWEGNTMVVETTNQRAQVFLDQRGRFYTDEARVVERFTLLDANTMHYQATIEDSNVYTRPFTIAVAFRRNVVPNVELWEEACYEDNTLSMEHFRGNGYGIYPGITGAEARALRQAFESRGGAR